jgi:hypothetical protein
MKPLSIIKQIIFMERITALERTEDFKKATGVEWLSFCSESRCNPSNGFAKLK